MPTRRPRVLLARALLVRVPLVLAMLLTIPAAEAWAQASGAQAPQGPAGGGAGRRIVVPDRGFAPLQPEPGDIWAEVRSWTPEGRRRSRAGSATGRPAAPGGGPAAAAAAPPGTARVGRAESRPGRAAAATAATKGRPGRGGGATAAGSGNGGATAAGRGNGGAPRGKSPASTSVGRAPPG